MAELLVELYGDELPDWAQKQGAHNLPLLLHESLKKRNLLEKEAKAIGYASARRLAIRVQGVLPESKAQEIETRGPREGANEKALEGFLRKAGFSSTEDKGVELRETPKGKFWFATKLVPPSSAEKEVPEAVVETLHAMRWKKSMRWETSGFRWPRPLRRYMVLLDTTPIVLPKAETLPPFIGGANEIKINEAVVKVSSVRDWQSTLEQGQVKLLSNEELQTTFPTERPCTLTINPKAEGLPDSFVPIILQHHLSTSKNPAGGYDYIASLPHGLSEAEEAEWQKRATEQVEKVAQSRLDDALFYWQRDKELGLEGLYERLDEITFHPKLGSVRLHAKRVSNLIGWAAPEILFLNRRQDKEQLKRLCEIVLYAKVDLASGTVTEIPELQGKVGAALFSAEENFAPYKNCVHAAYGQLDTFDRPVHAISKLSDDENALPAPELVTGLASQIDFLIGFMAVGERATGSRDPYGLRTCATLICRYLLQHSAQFVSISGLLTHALGWYRLDKTDIEKLESASDFPANSVNGEAMSLLKDRLEHYLRTEQNISYDITRATMNASSATGNVIFWEIAYHAIHLQNLLANPNGEKLIRAWRRAQGLLKESGLKPIPCEKILSESSEEFNRALLGTEEQLKTSLGPVLRVQVLEQLSDPVNRFLDEEAVLAGEEKEQQARLALLDRFIQVVKRVADLDYIEGGDITARKDSARLNQG